MRGSGSTGTSCLTGFEARSAATMARLSSDVMPVYDDHGISQMRVLGRRRLRPSSDAMIWSSVNLPMPVSGSLVMLGACTVP
jgi:hypothetical protein